MRCVSQESNESSAIFNCSRKWIKRCQPILRTKRCVAVGGEKPRNVVHVVLVSANPAAAMNTNNRRHRFGGLRGNQIVSQIHAVDVGVNFVQNDFHPSTAANSSLVSATASPKT